MADAAQVAEDFFAAWTGKDFNRARALLHDDLSFSGPIDTFDNADAYVQAIQGLSQIVTGADKRKVFVDGNDVCVIYDLRTAPVPSAPTAEWYRIRDDRIVSIQVFFDARPFAPCSRAARACYVRRRSQWSMTAMWMVAAWRTASAALAPTRTGGSAAASGPTAEDACSATWSGGRTLRELDGQEVRLRCSLLSADLYSYWID